jgi:hypothetical protein
VAKLNKYSSLGASIANIKAERAEVINRVLTEWSVQFVNQVEAQARLKIKADTGEGGSSFDQSIIKAGINNAASVLLSFNEYLRYFDMRNSALRRDGDLGPKGLERMSEWVDRNYNKLIGGYNGPVTKRSGEPIARQRIVNNMAWGISKKRTRLKRAQWYNKLKSSEQYNLYFKMLDELLPVMLEETKQSVI